jgi:hypothetical protein
MLKCIKLARGRIQWWAFCGLDKEPSKAVKGRKFLVQLRDFHFHSSRSLLRVSYSHLKEKNALNSPRIFLR